MRDLLNPKLNYFT